MDPSCLEQLRLSAFKSFTDARLDLGELTLLVGRNGSGKSNALDGLWVLSRLAHGDDVRDALGGKREELGVRGGITGCAPLGTNELGLGCRVRTGTVVTQLDVRVQVAPWPRIVYERLQEGGDVLLETDPPAVDSGDIWAGWNNRKQGPNPKVSFLASRLLATQVATRVPIATKAGLAVHSAAARVLAALDSVFVLDPVPPLMRGYVPSRDSVLRRDADNLSAAVGALLGDPPLRATLVGALSDLSEHKVLDVGITRSDLDDVMLTVEERFAGHDYSVPARMMSDGTLRFLAIVVALLQSSLLDDTPAPGGVDQAVGQTTVVIEELENGLHASQAGILLHLVREQVGKRRVRLLATTHSPALLDVLSGDEHRSVVVCQRDTDGASHLQRLTDLPNYVDVVTGGGLGAAARADRLRLQEPSRRKPSEVLAEIFEDVG